MGILRAGLGPRLCFSPLRLPPHSSLISLFGAVALVFFSFRARCHTITTNCQLRPPPWSISLCLHFVTRPSPLSLKAPGLARPPNNPRPLHARAFLTFLVRPSFPPPSSLRSLPSPVSLCVCLFCQQLQPRQQSAGPAAAAAQNKAGKAGEAGPLSPRPSHCRRPQRPPWPQHRRHRPHPRPRPRPPRPSCRSPPSGQPSLAQTA